MHLLSYEIIGVIFQVSLESVLTLLDCDVIIYCDIDIFDYLVLLILIFVYILKLKNDGRRPALLAMQGFAIIMLQYYAVANCDLF